MKIKFLVAACVLAVTFSSVNSARAVDESDSLKIIADTLVVRPVCLAATVIGSAFFVVSLPIAAVSKSVKRTAHTLVIRPAKATFTRPLGDMDSLEV